MEGLESLVQTIAILAACIVFLAKQGMEVYQKKKNGISSKWEGCKVANCANMVEELHGWHKPIQDPKTGQPRFMWYENNADLQKELSESRKAMDGLRSVMERLIDTIEAKTGEKIAKAKA